MPFRRSARRVLEPVVEFLRIEAVGGAVLLAATIAALALANSPLPLPPAADGSVEAALVTQAPLALADLRAASTAVGDAESFGRLRMEGSFTDVPVFDAFDAVAYIPHTSCTDYVTAQYATTTAGVHR